jgi:hypothetical protein
MSEVSLPDTFVRHYELVVKRLPYRISSLESATPPEGADDE